MSTEPCAVCGRVSPVEVPQRGAKPHILARLMRWLLTPMGRWSHGFLALAVILAIREMAVNWVTPFLNFPTLIFIFLCLFLVGLWGVKLLARGGTWLFNRTDEKRRPGWKSFLVLPSVLLLLVVSNHLKLPLRAAFWLSHSALETTSRKPPFGAWSKPKQRAGLFTVRQIDKYKGGVRIEVADSIFLSGTRAGFARCPNGCKAANFPSAFADWNKEPTYLRLSSEWYWWEQTGSDF